MIPTSETLLCTSVGFNVKTATPCQRARRRISDGLPLEELRDDPEVVRQVGGPEAIAMLPSERGIAPAMVIDASSIRSCKTMGAVCCAGRGVFVVDTGPCKIGEVVRLPIFSLKLSRARVAFRMLKALFQRPALAPLVISETAESLIVRSPSGVPIEITCVAGGRAAADFVGDWLAGVICDEAPRMRGADEGVTNLHAVLEAIEGRMLPGAQIQLIGSPWSPSGPFYDLFTEHWGKPSPSVVVLRSTGPMNNPLHFTPELCAAIERSNPVAYATNVMADFADPESGLFSITSVRSNTRETPLECLPEKDATYAAALDTSEGSAGGNPWTLCVVEVFEAEDGEDAYKVMLVREWRGQGPESILAEVADICRRYSIEVCITDQYAGSALKDLARHHGLTLHIEPWRATSTPEIQSKLEKFTNAATLLHTDRIELPPDRQFRRDLLSVKKRTTANGATIVLPKTSDGRHADHAPSFVLSIWAAQNALPADLSVSRPSPTVIASMAARGHQL